MGKKPGVLCIMDGFGLRNEKHGNAIYAAYGTGDLEGNAQEELFINHFLISI